MKTAMAVILGFIIASSADAKWRPLTESELIARSTEIVVAEFVSMTEAPESYYKTQKAHFRMIEVIKGVSTNMLTVAGTTAHICAPIVSFSGKESGQYLLLLYEKGGLYHSVNGYFSLLPIIDGKVDWFMPGHENVVSPKRTPLELSVVLKRIQKIPQ